MSMAARAISSRAVSSISLGGIGGINPLSPRLAAETASQLELRPSPPAGERERPSALVLTLVAAELVLDGVDQGLPGRFDDIVGHAHRSPRLVAVAGGDQHAGPGCGALALVEDANLVVEQAHLAQARIEVLERLSEGVVKSVDGAVARSRGMLGDALDLEAHRGFRHRLRLAALLLDDDAEAVEVEVGLVVAERALHEE